MIITLIILLVLLLLTIQQGLAVVTGRVLWIVAFILVVIALVLVLLPFAHTI